MAKMDFQAHRERLFALRARLHGEMTQLADSALTGFRNESSSVPRHLADLGSDNFEQELTLTLLGSEKQALEQIEAAIQRLADGSYGKCEECEGGIPAARLEAIPYAALCVGCASKREQEIAEE